MTLDTEFNCYFHWQQKWHRHSHEPLIIQSWKWGWKVRDHIVSWLTYILTFFPFPFSFVQLKLHMPKKHPLTQRFHDGHPCALGSWTMGWRLDTGVTPWTTYLIHDAWMFSGSQEAGFDILFDSTQKCQSPIIMCLDSVSQLYNTIHQLQTLQKTKPTSVKSKSLIRAIPCNYRYSL